MNLKTRREAIKGFLSVGLVTALYNPFQRLWTSEPDQIAFPEWKSLIDFARWCPTVHNLQPHKVKVISPNRAEIYYDPKRLLPVGDPNSIFASVAMGIFIEHLSIAAATSGYSVEVVEMGNPISIKSLELTKFVTVELQASSQTEELGRELIMKRKTSRMPYNGKPLKQETIDKLKTEATHFNHEFFSTSDDKLIDFLIELNQETLFEDLSADDNRTELDKLFRYTKEDAEEKKDGLWAECMGFPGRLMRSVFQKHEKWEKGLRKKMLAKQYKSSFDGTATICWMSGKFDNAHDWVHAGRLLARMWLQITKEGAYLQPCGSLITNDTAYAKIKETFPKPMAGNELWMLFRVGYSKEPTRSYRLETSEILIN